mgnify:CR=1 FL=1|tara:strand:- start:13580 stop:14347 length:768 start_codon:yes stop_codon:yes gene_type:complete
MLMPRIIPCLLIHKDGLVKSVNFKDYKYIGDPINTVKIFNEKEVDELIVLDIDATRNNTRPNFNLISKIASECRMPLCYGGGVKTVNDAKEIIRLGVEKVSVSSAAIENPQLVSEIANEIGSQSISVVIDYKKNIFGNYEIWINNGQVNTKKSLLKNLPDFTSLGAGELIFNSISNDGTLRGYDISLAKNIRSKINTPITFLGGASSYEDMSSMINEVGVVGLAAGSLFVFKGKYKAVLINYPKYDDKVKIFKSL